MVHFPGTIWLTEDQTLLVSLHLFWHRSLICLTRSLMESWLSATPGGLWMQVSSSEGPSPLMNRKVCGRPFCPRDSPPSVQRLALHGAGLFASIVLCFRVRIASRCCTRSLLMGVCRKGREKKGFWVLNYWRTKQVTRLSWKMVQPVHVPPVGELYSE